MRKQQLLVHSRHVVTVFHSVWTMATSHPVDLCLLKKYHGSLMRWWHSKLAEMYGGNSICQMNSLQASALYLRQTSSCYYRRHLWINRWTAVNMYIMTCHSIQWYSSSYHMSSEVEYSVLPSSTSGGRYHNVTTSCEYVWHGTDLARANPVSSININLIETRVYTVNHIESWPPF